MKPFVKNAARASVISVFCMALLLTMTLAQTVGATEPPLTVVSIHDHGMTGEIGILNLRQPAAQAIAVDVDDFSEDELQIREVAVSSDSIYVYVLASEKDSSARYKTHTVYRFLAATGAFEDQMTVAEDSQERDILHYFFKMYTTGQRVILLGYQEANSSTDFGENAVVQDLALVADFQTQQLRTVANAPSLWDGVTVRVDAGNLMTGVSTDTDRMRFYNLDLATETLSFAGYLGTLYMGRAAKYVLSDFLTKVSPTTPPRRREHAFVVRQYWGSGPDLPLYYDGWYIRYVPRGIATYYLPRNRSYVEGFFFRFDRETLLVTYCIPRDGVSSAPASLRSFRVNARPRQLGELPIPDDPQGTTAIAQARLYLLAYPDQNAIVPVTVQPNGTLVVMGQSLSARRPTHLAGPSFE